MILQKVAAPAAEPLTLAEAKLFLRVTNDREDDLITGQVKAARASFERVTGRAVVTQRWRALFERFPAGGLPIQLPRPPLSSVTAISYRDSGGVSRTLAADQYRTVADSGVYAEPGLVVPSVSGWPDTEPGVPDAVSVEFTAGYGTAGMVPDGVKAVISQLLGGLYEERQTVAPVRMSRVPAIESLLAEFVVSDTGVLR